MLGVNTARSERGRTDGSPSRRSSASASGLAPLPGARLQGRGHPPSFHAAAPRPGAAAGGRAGSGPAGGGGLRRGPLLAGHLHVELQRRRARALPVHPPLDAGRAGGDRRPRCGVRGEPNTYNWIVRWTRPRCASSSRGWNGAALRARAPSRATSSATWNGCARFDSPATGPIESVLSLRPRAARTRHEDPRVPGQGGPRRASACPCPQGKVAYTVAEAVEAAKELGFPVVVKAQIHAGGRGKGGRRQAGAHGRGGRADRQGDARA